MKLIVGIILLLGAFIALGAMMRRKIYREVDRLSLWKIDILNRPISEEIATVKTLQMVGETEKRFEQWRAEWEQIVTADLPELEERLIDAEEASDRYRYKRAREALQFIEKELQLIEERLSLILDEVSEWVASGEESKLKIITIQAEYNEAKQYLLSHYPSFGQAAQAIETLFKEMDENLAKYDKAMSEGNYPTANKDLHRAEGVLAIIKEKLEKIPEYRLQLTSAIPKKIAQVERDIAEMESKGFILERRSFENEIETVKRIIAEELKKVEKGDSTKTDERVSECSKRIESLYDLLEKEVESKRIVVEHQLQLTKKIEDLQKGIADIKSEIDIVKERYRIDDKDLRSQVNLEKRISELQSQFETIEELIANNERSYTTIQQMLVEIEEKITELQKLSDDYAEMLSTLRKDELEAKDTIVQIVKQLYNIKRIVQRYNLPGVPDNYYLLIEEAEATIDEVEEKLQESPLDIPAINYALKKALEVVETSTTFTEEMIETALLSEKLIQYGNRYRSQSRSLDGALIEAEAAFRRYDYADALEVAARAIEPIDPDALKEIKIEMEEIEQPIPIHG